MSGQSDDDRKNWVKLPVDLGNARVAEVRACPGGVCVVFGFGKPRKEKLGNKMMHSTYNYLGTLLSFYPHRSVVVTHPH